MARVLYECPKPGCMYRLLLWEYEDPSHRCPHGGYTKIGLSVTMSLVGQCWQDLDEIMDQLMSPEGKKENPQLGEYIWRSVDDHIKYERLRGQARGMAALLARFMVPFFRTPDEIAKEATRRYNARKSGDVSYETPGLAARKYEFPSDDKYRGVKIGADAGASAAPRRASSPAKKALTRRPLLPYGALTDVEIAAIKRMKGQMTLDELSMIYSTTPEIVNKIWNE